MSDTKIGRALYINNGVALGSFLDGEVVGQLSIDDSGGIYQWQNGAWVQVGQNGAMFKYDATLRAGEDPQSNRNVTEQQNGYYPIAAGQTDATIGATGAAGDRLKGCIITANTNTIVIKDGATTVHTIPASTALGWYELGEMTSQEGAWNITTGVTTSAIFVGRGTA